MIRYFCDGCGKEMTDRNTPALGRNGARMEVTVTAANRKSSLGVEIITSLDGTGNAGHFCTHCIIDAVNALDDRPRVRAA